MTTDSAFAHTFVLDWVKTTDDMEDSAMGMLRKCSCSRPL